MNFYRVSFPGLWADGIAILQAKNADQAKERFLKAYLWYFRDKYEDSEEDLIITEIIPQVEGVLFFDTGDERGYSGP